MGVKVNSKKLNRIVERAKKRDYGRFVRRKRIITITSAAVLASGAVGGIVYGFWFLSQKSTKPAFAALPTDSNDLILGDQTFCGETLVNGSESFSCYAGQTRVTSTYPNLINESRTLEISDWIKNNINRGPEGAVLSSIKFAPGVDSTAGITLAYRSSGKSKISILMSPDAQDYVSAYAQKALEAQAIEKYEKDLKSAANGFYTLLRAIFATDTTDTSVPRTATGTVDTSDDVGYALSKLLISSGSLANWTQGASADGFLHNIYKLLFRNYYTFMPSSINSSTKARDLNSTDPWGTLYDRTLVSTLINAPDPLFVNQNKSSLLSYYSSKGIDFSKDILSSLQQLDKIHAELMQGKTSVDSSNPELTNSELTKSAFVKAAKALSDYIKSHDKIAGQDANDLIQPFLKLLFQDQALAKAAFSSYADTSGNSRSRGANLDISPGVSTLQPLLFSNFQGYARRFLAASKLGPDVLTVDAGRDTVSYNVNNSEILAYSPNSETLGESIASGKWFANDEFYSKFNERLYVSLFSDMAYTMSHEYGHHYTIWNLQNGEAKDLINVFHPKDMSATPMNKGGWNALLEAETNGGNLDNWQTPPVGTNVFALKNLIMSSDASSATTTTPLIAASLTNSFGAYASSRGGFLDVRTFPDYSLTVLNKGGLGKIGTDHFYVDYVRSLLELIYQEYLGSGWDKQIAASYSSSNSPLFSKRASSFKDYLDNLYDGDSSEKKVVSDLLDQLATEINKNENARSLTKIGFLATQIIQRVYVDASNNITSLSPSAGLPSLVKVATAVPGASSVTVSPLIAKLPDFIEQRSRLDNRLVFGEPYLASQADSLGFSKGGNILYDGVFGDYVLSYQENLTRIWQVLTLPVDERFSKEARKGQPFVSRSDTETDDSYLRSLGVEIYDEKTGFLTETGKRLVDFYRSAAGLIVDKQSHRVIDAQELHQFNMLFNNGFGEISGWIKKSDADKVKSVQLKNISNGQVFEVKVFTKNVSNNHYYSKKYEKNNAGEYFRDPAYRESDFSGDYVQWQSDYFPIGDFSNVSLQQGDYDVSFVFDGQSGGSTAPLTKMLGDGKFNGFAENKETLNPNSFTDLLSYYYFALVDNKVQLHVTGKVA